MPAGCDPPLCAILGSLIDAVVIIGQNGVIESFSRGAERLFGYRAEEAVGANISILMPEPFRSEHDDYLRRYRETGRARVIGRRREVEGVRKDGSVFPADLAVSEIRLHDRRLFVGVARDISERKRAEERLRQNAQEIRDLYDNAPCGYHSLDKNGIFVRINDTELSWLGYSRDEVVGKMRFTDVITEQGANNFLERFPQFVKQGYVHHLAFDMVRKDGTTFPVLLSATALKDEQGNFLMSRSTVFDVTEQERAVRESEERYRLLAEYSSDMISRLSPEGAFIYVSPASANLFGYEPSDLQGRSSFERVHPGDVESVRQAFFGVLTHYTLETVTYRVKVREGHYIWVETSLRGVRRSDSPRALEIVGVFRDVTDRVRAAEALNHFKHILDDTLDMLFLFEPDTLRFVYANRGAMESLGYTGEELLQMTPYQIKPLLSEAHFRKLIAPLLSGEKPSFGFETLCRRKDGTDFPVEISLQLVKEKDEKGLFIALVRDISERKRTEEIIRGLNRHLRHRNVELGAINQELETFSYSVSHDLRAPLRSIDGFSKALLEDYAGRLDETGKDYLRRVRGATQRMGTLIDDLLNLSRVTRHKMGCEQVNLSRLAEQLAAEFEGREPERNVKFVIAPAVTVEGDPGLIGIVMENLLGNAWKYTSKHPAARIEFGFTDEEGERVYFVRDDGAGFDMAYAGKLFGAFQRLHGADEFPGSGIGLATAQRIVHRHGGRIWAEGEVEKGATFYFTLQPCAASEETA